MKVTKFLGLGLGLGLVLAGQISAQTTVQFLTEGYTGGVGKIDDVIAASVKDAKENPDATAASNSNYRAEKW